MAKLLRVCAQTTLFNGCQLVNLTTAEQIMRIVLNQDGRFNLDTSEASCRGLISWVCSRGGVKFE